MIKKNLILEDLMINNLKIYQAKGQYSYTSDSTILAQFVDVRKNDKIVEACAGSGIISILLTTKGAEDIACFEIQEQMTELAKMSVNYNCLQDKIKVICDDFQNAPKYIDKVDCIVCNPPYYKSGKRSENTSLAMSKFETNMTLENLIQISSKLLKDKGRFYICFAVSRLNELFSCLTKYKLEPKIMFFSQKDEMSKPSCVFVKCVKNANSGIEVLPALFTHDKDGKFVLSTSAMFEKYKKLI